MLLALYFVVPLDRSDAIPIGASLALALVVLLGVAVWQMKATIRSSHPPIRAVEALGVTVPLFLFCLLYTSPSPRDRTRSRMPSSA